MLEYVKRGKPFPDVYLKALEEANINKEEVIVFEDSPNGIRSAYNAGLKVVFVEDLSPADEEKKIRVYINLSPLEKLCH